MEAEETKNNWGGGGTTKGLRGVRGETRDIAMGHMVNKSDVRDPGEALHP